MSEQYEFERTSNQSAIGSYKVLAESGTTRLILHYDAIDNPKNPEARIKIDLIHQRKSPKGTWEDSPSLPLSSLRAGERFKLHLHSATTLNLYKQLGNLYAAVRAGKIGQGLTKRIVGDPNEIIKTDAKRAEIIRHLLAKGFSQEIWNELIRTDPDLATRLSYARIHAERAAILKSFQTNLTANRAEEWWQDFFERNTWIFGYGLNYQILKSVQAQPRYGGLSVTGRGVQKGDYLQRTEAAVKFTVLVEIKRPDTKLLGNDQYRNGAWALGGEVAGGVVQMHANCSAWEKEGSRNEANQERLTQRGIFTVQPKGILVIGHTNQLNDRQKRSTFEMFRRSMHNPEILTFDELYERAKFIVKHTEQPAPISASGSSDSEPDDDEIPF